MKHLNRRLPVKILSFILCIVFLVTAAAGIVGAVTLAYAGAYTQPLERTLQDRFYANLLDDSYLVTFYALNEAQGQSSRYAESTTNIRFRLLDPNGITVSANTDKQDAVWQYRFLFKVNLTLSGLHCEHWWDTENTEVKNIYTLDIYLEDGLPVEDEYALMSWVVHTAYALKYWIYPIIIVSLALCIFFFISLLCAAARKPHSEQLHPGILNKVPFDLLLALNVLLLLGIFAAVRGFYGYSAVQYFFHAGLVLVALCAALGLCISAAARIKQHTLLRNTVIWKTCSLLWKVLKKLFAFFRLLLRSLPLIWRTVLLVVGWVLLDLFVTALATNGDLRAPILWVLQNGLLILAALYGAIFMRQLQRGGDALAKGDLHYKTDTSIMFWDFKRHGENLNSIADGMAAAVEKRLQSERMKTELITNVSHDIKTPLTSIINYSSLIAESGCDCEQHREYSDVLVRKSQHLKRLLEDLVEASKAATGNLEVELAACDAGVLLSQVAGEFEQRCEAAGLSLIACQPESSVSILADSRRIWRVFENLMDNACKYSLPGSRVYLSLARADREAVFTFRNTSAALLNITPEELTERFVRGDSARSTEGSGLGLAIARSLTELQNGKMDIAIDGDLFKVTLRFPLADS